MACPHRPPRSRCAPPLAPLHMSVRYGGALHGLSSTDRLLPNNPLVQRASRASDAITETSVPRTTRLRRGAGHGASICLREAQRRNQRGRPQPGRRHHHTPQSSATFLPTRSTPPPCPRDEGATLNAQRAVRRDALAYSPRALAASARPLGRPATHEQRRGWAASTGLLRHPAAHEQRRRESLYGRAQYRSRPRNFWRSQRFDQRRMESNRGAMDQESPPLLGNPRNTQPDLGVRLHSGDDRAAVGHGKTDNHDP
jgi:hypothetical protein